LDAIVGVQGMLWLNLSLIALIVSVAVAILAGQYAQAQLRSRRRPEVALDADVLADESQGSKA
jgi:hypothetical protein